MQKIVVTGGAGFIGSTIVDALIGRGKDVHVIDNMSGGRLANIHPDATFHEMDIRDPAIGELFGTHQFDAMIHHAAQMDVRKSVADPSFDADVNVRGFLNLLEAGRKSGLQKVVFASTGGAIYGEPTYAPQDEQHPLKPLSPYGITKLCSEKYLAYYEHTYGIPYVALRYSNVYGPRQNPHGEAGVVAIFSQRMLSGAEAVINGDGSQTRDYVFVGDVVRANLSALDLRGSDIINIGTGKETSVNELFRIIARLTTGEVSENHGPGMPGEQERSVLSYAHASSVLDWSPEVDLESGLRKTVDWFRDSDRT